MITQWTHSQLSQSIGALMVLALLLIIAIPFTGLAIIWPALLLWCALILSWKNLAAGTKKQAQVLFGVGVVGMGWAYSQGETVSIVQALSSNSYILAMLMAVSFLSLIAGNDTQEAEEDSPRGRSALKQTLVGLHLFGAVINISIVFIMGDRFASAKGQPGCCTGEIEKGQLKVLSRGFCAAAFWSPFFAALAVALTYAPGADLLTLMQAGIPLAILSLTITYFELRPKAEQFTGYPMRMKNLILPAFLACAVIAGRVFIPELSVLQLISLLAPLTAIAVLAWQKQPLVKKVQQHSQNRLARMGNELALFLTAGTMAAGLNSLFMLYGHLLPIPALTPIVISLLLLAMLVLSLIGVHPVISIATVSGILLPTEPPVDLLAMVFLASWAIGTACSPMSGMSLSLRGRYFISARQILRSNLAYGVVMWLAASISLWLYNPISGI
ncbi:hypothetical protein [Oceanospirillum beijerinckii]|uniref:hypothetical protein n=1 Tax=Oceanospirillum beijerinckii TaxID=64976 RepID=UPI0003F628D7|nr:hypothetical protein [Oceanospirillum beijerinckii]